MTKHIAELEKEKEVSIYDQPISSEILLRSNTMTEAIIDQLRRKNDESGIEMEVEDNSAKSRPDRLATRRVKARDVFIEYEGSYSKKKKLRWLAQTQNQKTGGFFTMDDLIKHDIMDESERSLFELPQGIDDFPYRQIYQLHRIKTQDGKEWLSTHEMWVGITKGASVVTLGIDDIHYYIKPTVTYELRNNDGSMPGEIRDIDSRTVRVARTRVAPNNELNGTKVYITPFTPEAVQSALKCTRGALGDNYNGCSVALYKEGHSSYSIGCRNLDEFLTPFDEIWKRNSSPPSSFNDFLNDFRDKMSNKDKDKQGKDDTSQSQYR